MSNTLLNVYNKETIDSTIISKLGLDKTNIGKFNTALITKTENGISYIEYWLLINASYDYTNQRFVKEDITATSFGIQLQAKGTYPGEAELGYSNNTGINVWRCPIWKENVSDENYSVFMDTDYYDYADTLEHNYIGAEYDNSSFWGSKHGTWREFGVATGWNNNFMTDSYGGITVGGAGFELDGNGIMPFARLTHSKFKDENNNVFYLVGVLDNAYHPDEWSNWKCDSNQFGAFFYGLKIPQSQGAKNYTNAKFVVMYNDMDSIDSTDNNYNIEQMDVSDWITIFEVDTNGAKAMSDGSLSSISEGLDGSDGDDGTGIDSIELLSTSGLVKTYRINLTDNTHFDFNVSDGADGSNGSNGVKGDKGDKGDTGATGKGISSIIKTSTNGLVDTYTITYSDSTTSTFTVNNGAKGDTGATGATGETGPQGPQGIQGVQGPQGDPFSIYKTYASISAMNADKSNVAEGKFVIISSNVNDEDNAKLYVKGSSDFSFITDLSGATGIQGPQGIQGEQGPTGATGATGATGKGISSIAKTGTSGLVDTYTITYTDNTTSIFTVKNGADGSNGSNATATPLTDTITDGDTTHAVTGNAVHDALALKADSTHNQNLSTINNVTTVAVVVTYTDNTSETINLVKYTGS